MKLFLRHLPLALSAITTMIGVTSALSAWATTNCYNYSGSGSCPTNKYCQTFSVVSAKYCKQLTNPPYIDPGCCGYTKTTTTWSSVNNGTCPCASAPTIDITGAANTPLAQCVDIVGATAPDNTEVKGTCTVAPPG